MRKLLLSLTMLLGLSLPAQSQGNTVLLLFPGVPSGNCAFIMLAIDNSNGELYDCDSGAWNLVGPGAAGAASWSSLSDPTAVTVFNSGATAELFQLNFTAAYGATADLVDIEQLTGNPLAGSVLFKLSAADADILLMQVGDTNGIQVTQAGAMTVIGSGAITATLGDSATAFFSTGTIEDARLSAAVALSSDNLSFFAATTSAEFLGVISNETGTTGLVVASINPTLTDVIVDDLVTFTETAGDATCAAGDYWLKGNSTANTMRGCENGTLFDLNTAGGGNSFGTIGAAVADSGADTLTVTDSGTIDFTTTDNPEDFTAIVIADSINATQLDETVAFAFSSTTSTFVGASFTSGAADPADGGVLRVGNTQDVFCSELAIAGVDLCLQLDASDIWQMDGTFNAATLTEGGTAVPNTGDNLSVFAATTSAQFFGVISNETGGTLVVGSDAPTFTTSITTPVLISAAGDPADAGVIRLGNAETLCWEPSPTGTDVCFSVNASEVFAFDNALEAPSFTGTGSNGYIEFPNSAAATAPVNTGRLRYVSGTQDLELSKNAVAYSALATASENLSFFAATTVAQLATLLSDEDFTPGSETSAEGVLDLPDLQGLLVAGQYGAASIDGDDINTNLAGSGLVLTAAAPDTLDIDLIDIDDQTGSSSNQSGLEFGGTGAADLGLLRACTNGQLLKFNTTGGLWECQNDNDSGGSPAWEALVNSADTATSFLSNNTAETVTFSFESAFGASQQFLVRQQTGNPTTGTLLDVRAADTDVTVFRAGDGTNGITVSQAGALTAEGTGTITATDLASGTIDALGEFAAALCGTNEILEDQGGSWACIATPAGGTVRWDELTDPTAVTVFNSNAVAELLQLNFTAAYGATDDLVDIEQLTGNPAAGSVLFKLSAADVDILLFQAGATNGVQINQAGVLSIIGSGNIIATELAAGVIQVDSSNLADSTAPVDFLDTSTINFTNGVLGDIQAAVIQSASYGFTNTANTFTGASYTSAAADPADGGVLRAGNAQDVFCAELATPGVDLCLQLDASDLWQLDGTLNVATAIQQGGTQVVLETRTLTGGNGIATIGDLSANRTVSVDLLTADDQTGSSSNQSGLEFGDTSSDKLGLLRACTNGQVLKFNTTGGLWACQNDNDSGGAPTLDSITAAGAANTINSGDDAQVWNWSLTTAAKVAFKFGEDVAGIATGNPILLNAVTLAASTVHPFQATARGTTDGIRVGAADGVLIALGTGGLNWPALLGYPTGCTNQFVRTIADTLTCNTVGTSDLAAGAADNTIIRDSAGFSVIGKSTTGTGDPADIVAADETVFGRTGAGNLVFAQVATGQIANSAVTSLKLATANKTFDKSIAIIDPTTAEDDKVQWMHGKAVTYTDVDCSTDQGTATIDMDHRVITTPNTVGTDILTGTIVCDTDNQADGGFADATIPANVPVNLSITAVSGTPGTVRIHIRGTID